MIQFNSNKQRQTFFSVNKRMPCMPSLIDYRLPPTTIVNFSTTTMRRYDVDLDSGRDYRLRVEGKLHDDVFGETRVM